MIKYDVAVIGAGPAGGQCARTLSKMGYTVLIAEKAADFHENNYSSGGAPAEMMADFELPDSIVGAYWSQLNIVGTTQKSSWSSPRPLGPILHFDKLRQFLCDDAIKHNGDSKLLFKHSYHSHKETAKGVNLFLNDLKQRKMVEVEAKVLIDATGSERKVLSQPLHKKSCAASGVEYHIQVSPELYAKHASSLSFYLGHKWMPQGYAWVFPKEQNQLKVGVIRYFKDDFKLPYPPSYQLYLKQLMQSLGLDESAQILDRHGKTINYTMRQKDQRVATPLLAVGDAISAINPLGSEGIRHGLASGDIAARHVDLYLRGDRPHMQAYQQEMDRYFGWKWWWSEKLMKGLYCSKNDFWIDQAVKNFGLMNCDEIYQVVFHYRFRHTCKSYLRNYMALINPSRLF